MGKKYDELYKESLDNSLEVSARLVRVAIELMKLENALKRIVNELTEISNINASIAKSKEKELENGENHDWCNS